MSAAWPSGKERCNCDRYGLGLKPTCAILLCLEKETLRTFPCLMVLARSSKFQSYLCKKKQIKEFNRAAIFWQLLKQIEVIA